MSQERGGCFLEKEAAFFFYITLLVLSVANFLKLKRF